MNYRVKYFKALKSTKRFRKNQKVWIVADWGNCLRIRFRWRGSGRYVRGIISKHDASSNGPNKTIGEYHYPTVEVTEAFYKRNL